MNKRILSLLLAVAMLCTLVFTGCDDADKKATSDENASQTTPLSTRELFGQSIMNALAGGSTSPAFTATQGQDCKTTIQLVANELNVAGTDYLTDGAVEGTIDLAMDGDSGLSQMDLKLTMLGETVPLSAVIGEDAMYITDLLGVNDKPIQMSFEDMGMEEDMTEAFAMLEEYAALGQYIEEALSLAVKTYIPDSAFVSETKDCTVGDTQFTGATVITLTLTTDMLEKILNDLVAVLSENPAFSSMFVTGEELDFSDLGEGQVVITNTIVDQTTVALDATVQEGSASDGETVCTFTSYFLESGTKISLAVPEENMSIDFISTVKDGAVDAALSITADGETMTPLTVEGTYDKDGALNGTLAMEIEGESISVDFSAQGDANNGSFAITGISTNLSGATLTIPMELRVSYTTTTTRQQATIVAKMDMEGVAALDVSMDIAVEMTDVTVSSVTDSVSIDEVDPMEWSDKLMEKYPKIVEWISSLAMSSMGEYADAYSYDYDDIDYDELMSEYDDYSYEELELIA